jgi:putative endonuclease
MLTQRTQLGLAAETAACQWLAERGYRILDRNWRRPWGELDIVACRNDNVVCFVEVKASSHQQAGFDPFLRADGTKMHKVRRTAQTWLAQHRYSADTEWQLDIISVIMDAQNPQFEHFENI